MNEGIEMQFRARTTVPAGRWSAPMSSGGIRDYTRAWIPLGDLGRLSPGEFRSYAGDHGRCWRVERVR